MALPIINTPTYELILPYSKQRVKYRPFLVKEEKILMLALESSSDDSMKQALKDIIHGCTFGTLEASSSHLCDLEYLFAHLRAKSVGETARVGLSCTACDKQNAVAINLENVKVIDIPESDVVKLGPNLSIKMKLLNFDETDEAMVGAETDVEQIYAVITSSIVEIFFEDDSFTAKEYSKQELAEFIDSMTSSQFNAIRDYVKSSPTATLDVSFNCKECGESNETQLRGLQNFFG